MIIVQLMGGLGNQMFQYALYTQLRSQGKIVKMDDVTGYRDIGARQKQLSVFGITYDRCTQEELTALTDAYMDLPSRIRRKLFGRRTHSYVEKQFNFDETVFKLEEAYFEGCFQSERYFTDVKDKLRRDFAFPMPMPQECEPYREAINNTESVSIHIRRGDYLLEEQNKLYGGICTEEYYDKAVRYIQDRFPHCKFFVFSNDAEWAKKHYTGENFTVVDCNGEETGYLDMQLMSMCRHNIIANSSFSWWAAWLNGNREKIVLAPGKWLNGQDCGDIYTRGMLAI